MTKVLYVEHNDDNLYMLKTRLELLGDFQVLTAEDSEKGRNLAVTEHPDVILMGPRRKQPKKGGTKPISIA
jgi:CheY-like chemotaxis protein